MHSLLMAALLGIAHATTDWPDLTEPPPGRVTSKYAGDAALIITVEDYSIAPDIPGATQNGKDWFDWLLQVRGVDNVKILQDRQVSKGSMLTQAELMAGFVQEGGRLWIVFVGHGVPSESSDEGLLVGWAADQTPASIAEHSVSRQALLAAAERHLPSDSEIVLVQDACFSGRTATEQLLPGVQPLKTVSAKLGSRTTVLSAAANNEYAGSLSDGTRPAFSYLLLGALRGWDDDDTDGIVNASEAVEYARKAIQLTTNRSQTPTFEGPDVTLGRAARERGPTLAALQFVEKPIALVPTAPAGEVDIQAGKGRDYRAMAQESLDADAALKEAIRRKEEADRQLQRERRARLDRAKSQVQARARDDFEAIEALLSNPSAHQRVLQLYVDDYYGATVTIDGQSESVYIPQVARVMTVLSKLEASPSDASRSADFGSMAALQMMMLESVRDDPRVMRERLPTFIQLKSHRGRGTAPWLRQYGEFGFELYKASGERQYFEAALDAYRHLVALEQASGESSDNPMYMVALLTYMDAGSLSAYPEVVAFLRVYGVNRIASGYRPLAYLMAAEALIEKGELEKAERSLDLAFGVHGRLEAHRLYRQSQVYYALWTRSEDRTQLHSAYTTGKRAIEHPDFWRLPEPQQSELRQAHDRATTAYSTSR